MNVRDIEEAIHTLETRHPGLNETMLLTLLRAGGWEDRDVETAKMLFRSTPTTQAAKNGLVQTQSLPATQEAPLFEPLPDESHRIDAPHENAAPEHAPVAPVQKLEPVSLLSRDEKLPPPVKDEFPHNLPLRPFETSEHIWPFSRYKDIFFGEEASAVEEKQVVREAPSIQNVVAPTQVVVNVSPPPVSPPPVPQPAPPPEEPPRETLPPFVYQSVAPEREKKVVEKKVVIVERTGDEKLVIMAGIMLLAILLLLGYMYSNGRL